MRNPPMWVRDALNSAAPSIAGPQAVVGQDVTELVLLSPPEVRCATGNGKTGATSYAIAADGTFTVEDKNLRLLPPRVEWRSLKGAVGEEAISWGARILLSDFNVTERVNRASTQVSLSLLEQSGKVAEKTQRRLGSTFAWYAAMLGLLFMVGLLAFIAALANGYFRGPADTTTTLVFGGLSAISFVTFFLSKPVNAMGKLGPHSAWLLAIVNTYWTKLAYFNDPETIVEDIDKAQRAMDEAFIQYLKHAADFEVSHGRQVDDATSNAGGNSGRVGRTLEPIEPLSLSRVADNSNPASENMQNSAEDRSAQTR